jgi:NAD(P)-dependent dehydrogenase (short-subunit alcohol dehydrogenase family)
MSKTFLITGANRGIGAALSQSLTDRGDTVLRTARNGEGFLPLDVTETASHQALANQLDGQVIDTLVCNSGVYLDKGFALEADYDAETWAQTYAVNVTGVFLTVQHLLGNLRLSSSPKIAIISSQMGSSTRASGTSLIYRTSKAAALNLGFNLASALKDEGIAVGIYHPGWVRTDMGGDDGDIDVGEAVTGLVKEFDALSLASTGCFRTWDGRDHPI